MGRYTFFGDFLITDVSNHMEALKEMVKLGSEDDRFLVPALFHLAREDSSELDQENKGAGAANTNNILNELQHRNQRSNKRRDLKKNVFRMVQVISSLQSLRGHDYNIYECAYLSPLPDVLSGACICLVLQLALCGILLIHNYDTFNQLYSIGSIEIPIVVVSIATTIFFIHLLVVQGHSAWSFNQVFWSNHVPTMGLVHGISDNTLASDSTKNTILNIPPSSVHAEVCFFCYIQKQLR